MNDNNSSGKGWALGFGLLTGIAVGYYLNSNEGRSMQRKAKAQFDEYGNQVTTYTEQAKTKGQELVETAKTKGQEYLTDAKVKTNDLTAQAKVKLEEGKQWASKQAETVKETVDKKAAATSDAAKSATSNLESSFNRGVNKAERKMDENRERIDNTIEKNS
ncbi:hypothetical protein LEM8419_02265 [Neolewinella maritima]|uniref:YtxH domain-containing protein n=1 Tax=Neolewinella maritima TaxID=1383882 RepID=A0ABM9B1Y4_9BACT|nr:hypothetical protein [Neolewinella maritima]CAH1001364.1 hypothetical protein LEM8419_02265 [Neolewinella maritima]